MIVTVKSKLMIAAFLSSVSTAIAATPLQLNSDVFVERQVIASDGGKTVVLEKPDMITPGDSLVFIVRYKNVGASSASNFVVTNPLPAAVSFNGTADGLEIVSTDGGNKWGSLNTLRVSMADGTQRPARHGDVTHIKWKLNQTLTAGAEGKLIFRGIVR